MSIDMSHMLRVVSSGKLLIVLALGLLAGCGSSSIRNEIPRLICPAAGMVKDTLTVTKFRETGSYLEEDVLYTADMSRLDTACERESGGVVAHLAFDISASKGPASGTDQVSLPYFVAVTTTGGAIVSKQVFNAVIDLSDGGRGRVRELVDQHIQVEDDQDLRGYEILIGLQLTDDDLMYNLGR